MVNSTFKAKHILKNVSSLGTTLRFSILLIWLADVSQNDAKSSWLILILFLLLLSSLINWQVELDVRSLEEGSSFTLLDCMGL